MSSPSSYILPSCTSTQSSSTSSYQTPHRDNAESIYINHPTIESHAAASDSLLFQSITINLDMSKSLSLPRSGETNTPSTGGDGFDEVAHNTNTITYAHIQSRGSDGSLAPYEIAPMEGFEESMTSLVLGKYNGVNGVHYPNYPQNIDDHEVDMPQDNHNYIYLAFGNPHNAVVKAQYHEDLIGIGEQFTE
ncbi:hypothetical protein F5884DRAFT_758469 [Xylogone sp. PMI_703]|nr:hypothetical protein F5884DRAFT_758469 [Xylogone sp. PMI_703]